MQQNNNVHVKVQCDNEFRRFVLSEVTYNQLVETIRSLLGLAANSSFKLSYLDDEDDWVLFSTDSELQYAVSLSKSPLKISVSRNRESEVVAALPPHPFACPHKFSVEGGEEGVDKPWKWRGGRGGRGRGGRGGKRGECKAERINVKIARLVDRHATLTAKLIEGELPEEKARALEWRLSHLQNKIDSMKAKKEYIDACAKEDAHQQQQEAPVEKTTENDDEEEDSCEGDDEDHPHPPHAWPHRGGWGHGHGHGFGHGHGRRGGPRGGHCRRLGGEGHPHPHGFGGEHPPFPFPPPGEGHPHPHGFGGEHPPHPFFPHHPPHHFGGEHHGPGGCKRKGERRGECEGKGNKSFAHACSTPEGKAAFDRVHAAKLAVVTARRDKADKEVIIAKVIELKEAKVAWRAIKLALWKEQREQNAK